jgi:hypothetical protein
MSPEQQQLLIQQNMAQQPGLLSQASTPKEGFSGFLASPAAFILGSALSGASAGGENYKPFGQGMADGMKQLQEMRGNPLQNMQMQALMQEMQEKQAKVAQQMQAQEALKSMLGGQMRQNAPATSQEALSQATGGMQGGLPQQPPSDSQPQMPTFTVDPQRRKFAEILALSGNTDKAIEMLAPKQEEAFTIGEGQGRYDANGRLIAERGKNQTLSQGQVLFDSSGKKLAEVERDKSDTVFGRELAKLDAQTVGRSREGAESAGVFLKTLDQFDGVLKKVDPKILGPVVGGAASYRSKDAQQLEQLSNQLTLMAKGMLKMPSAGFSNTDLAFLEAASLGLNRDYETLVKGSQRFREINQSVVTHNQTLEKTARGKGSLEGVNFSDYMPPAPQTSPQNQSLSQTSPSKNQRQPMDLTNVSGNVKQGIDFVFDWNNNRMNKTNANR